MGNFSRRDILHGAALLPGLGLAPTLRGAPQDAPYPPAKTGLRGSHAGSFEVSHDLAWQGRRSFGPVESDPDNYDLVVVGGGVSGLAAAYFYRAQKPNAKILVLDNHDDFGGHAKRNEFTVDGQTLIAYGGSQSMETPSAYSDVAHDLLRELRVDLDVFDTAFDQDFYARHGLRGGMFFDQETYGRSTFVDVTLGSMAGVLGVPASTTTLADGIAAMPLSADDRAALLHLVAHSGDALEDVGLMDLADYLAGISYLQFVRERLGVKSEAVTNLLHDPLRGYYGIGIDAIPALEALALGMPGSKQLGVPGVDWLREILLGGLAEPYIHHYPDGNSSIARLLVRSLIPELSSRADPADVVNARFDYDLLDRAENNVRIRLLSTAVNVEPINNGVQVNYVQQGRHREVAAKHCVLACYNMMIPHICPGLPAEQKAALSELVKIPLVYTNVALKNWRALKELGIGMALSPNMFHQLMMLDFPVSMGGYQFSPSPDDPVVLHLSSALGAPGLPPRQQFRAGRAKLLATPYEQIERDIINHLTQLLGDGGFEASRDIAGITVNRWPHGYAYGHFSLFDPDYEDGQAPHEIGRKPWGPIAIANSDAGARAYLDEAINQAHRAVSELT